MRKIAIFFCLMLVFIPAMFSQNKLTPEMLIPRMGEYIVQKGLITDEQLQQALAHQQERIAMGETCLLGQALMDLKMIDRMSLDEVITEQIIQLRSALQSANRNLEQRVKERSEHERERAQKIRGVALTLQKIRPPP